MSWRGTSEIVRFNWPAYVAALVVCLLSVFVLCYSPVFRALAFAVLGITPYFTAASLLASHWIYDCSAVADWRWLPEWVGAPMHKRLLLQAGFDSTHGELLRVWPPGDTQTVDLYGTPGIGGVSVERAHQLSRQQTGTMSSNRSEVTGTYDIILAIFCLHEIQTSAARAAYFQTLTNRLTPAGRLLVVEHLRDWKNFLVYGFGFLHFRSEHEWRRCAAVAGLVLEKERTATPFVRVFLWRKLSTR